MSVLPASIRLFEKETMLNGHPARLECAEIRGQVFSITRGLFTLVTLDDEWFDEVHDPVSVIEALRAERAIGADIFSFCQRLPHTLPRFPSPHEVESVAAIPIDSYENWWAKQIEGATRNQIRKSRKTGVEVRLSAYDDEFVRGMTSIFNESPIRQGRRFWHYGKDFETVKQQFSRNLFREQLLGAYYEGELIGFAMVGRCQHYADLGQVIAKIQHREKSVTSALIDKAVAFCAEQQIRYLLYALWTNDSLGQFKRRHGFREFQLPRYFVPLTHRGRLALKTGLHRGVTTLLPASIKASLKHARTAWYMRRERGSGIPVR